jgi:WD40 repeat protein
VKRVQIWDAHTRTPLGQPLRLDSDLPLERLYYDGGKIAAQTALGVVEVWNSATMAKVATTNQNSAVWYLAVSPDGRTLATSTLDGILRLWNADNGQPIGQPLAGNGLINTIGFSSAAKLLAIGGSDKTLKLWATDTSKLVGNPLQADGTVIATAFSDDGHIVAAANADGTMRLWSVDDQSQLGAPFGHPTAARTLTFSPDSTKLLAGGTDGSIQMWPVSKPDPEALCAKVTHNMSHKQWDDWVSPQIPYIKVCPGLPETEDSG